MPQLSLQELVAQPKGGVVYLKACRNPARGFLITDTGVIATKGPCSHFYLAASSSMHKRSSSELVALVAALDCDL